MFDASGPNGTIRVTRLRDEDALVDANLERRVLGACLMLPHWLLNIELTARDFHVESHREIFRAMSFVFNEHNTCDTLHLIAQLADAGALSRVGGEEFIRDLTDIIPDRDAAPPTKRLRRLALLRRLRRMAALYGSKVDDAEASAKYREEIRVLEDELAKIDGKQAASTHRLTPLWKTLGEWGSLRTQPPPREWTLMRPDEETNGMANPVGLLPRGRVGMVVGPGGVGKSFALTGMAIAVATGRKWLDYFLVPKAGRVLLVLGEEDADEMARRLHAVVAGMRLTDDQVAMLERNLVVMPLAGEIAALVHQDGKGTVESDMMAFLRMQAGDVDWMLIIFDPLSRFAGTDTEKDNAQATAFIQTAETLCRLPGKPSVLFSHHSNKLSRADDAGRSSAADARGASGITDGGRWCCNFKRRDGGGVSLEFTKNNDGPDFADKVALERGEGGYLRVQSRAACQAADERERVQRDSAARQKVIAALTAAPGQSKTKLRSSTHLERGLVCDLVDDLVEDGTLIEEPKHSYRIRPQQGAFGHARD
ncbi:MAG: AAA family ATPase [Actinobacteria bacterium]|nr:AAA family ATPase [Actinomycetota bacterium]